MKRKTLSIFVTALATAMLATAACNKPAEPEAPADTTATEPAPATTEPAPARRSDSARDGARACSCYWGRSNGQWDELRRYGQEQGRRRIQGRVGGHRDAAPAFLCGRQGRQRLAIAGRSGWSSRRDGGQAGWLISGSSKRHPQPEAPALPGLLVVRCLLTAGAERGLWAYHDR